MPRDYIKFTCPSCGYQENYWCANPGDNNLFEDLNNIPAETVLACVGESKFCDQCEKEFMLVINDLPKTLSITLKEVPQ